MKHRAHGLEVVGLVRPRELHVRVKTVEGVVGRAVGSAQTGFRKDVQRRAMFRDQIGNGNAVDGRADGSGLAVRLSVHLARLMAGDRRCDVGFLHCLLRCACQMPSVVNSASSSIEPITSI